MRKGRFGLADLLPDALADADVRALALKAICAADPDTNFPTYFSGRRQARAARRPQRSSAMCRVNSGAGERALGKDGVVAKFMAVRQRSTVPRAHAERIRDAVLRLKPCTRRATSPRCFGEMAIQCMMKHEHDRL